jgi:hypothetical protein
MGYTKKFACCIAWGWNWDPTLREVYKLNASEKRMQRMKFTACKGIKRIAEKRNMSSFMFSTLKEHMRQKRHALTVIDKTYQRKKPLEEVDEDARTLLNLFSDKPGIFFTK